VANEWTLVAAVADVPSACPWPEFVIDDVTIVLVRDGDDAVRAVRSWCPHLGTPMTSAEVAGSVIECSRHFYTYDLETGRNTFPGDEEDENLEVFDVEVRGDDVWVRASAGAAGEGG
jgi:nitrite reductase/ring-hydroxylating ferredoxin subunit